MATETPSATSRRARTRHALAAAVVALMLGLTAWFAVQVGLDRRDAHRRDQRDIARQAAVALRSTFDQTLTGLAQGSTLVEPDGRVDLGRFQLFAGGIRRQAGILAAGYEVRVDASDRAAFERELGRPITDLRGGRLVPSAPRPVYYPIRAIEPAAARAVLGYDPAPEPARGQALRAAADSGQPRLASPTPLAITSGGTGLSAFAPLYDPRRSVRDVPARRAALIGFISAIYRAEDIAGLIRQQLPPGTRLRILDGGQVVVGGAEPLDGGGMAQLPIAGRRWTVQVLSPAGASYAEPTLIGIAGAAISALVALLFALDARRESEARAAAGRTALVGRAMHAMVAVESEDERLHALGREVVPEVADACVVHLDVRAGPPSPALVTPGEGGDRLARRAARVHRDVVAADQPEVLPGSGGEGPVVVVPMPARGERLGTLALGWAAGRPDPTPEEVEVASELGRRAGLAVENARLLDGERSARAAAEAAEERTSHLQALTGALSGALTPEDVATAILGHAEGLQGASGGALALLDQDGTRLRITGSRGVGSATEDFTLLPLDAEVALAAAVREGRPIWLTSRDEWERRFPRGAAAFAGSGRSGAIVPLNAGGRTLGALELVFPEEREFTAGDRTETLAVAEQCSQALERARLYQAEHELASTLQRSLLPPRLPDMPALDVAARYEPAVHEIAVGGDWYDAIELPGGRLGVAVGDVVGRGAAAAAVMGQLRSALRAHASGGAGPAEVLAAVSRFAEGVEDAWLTTACYAVLDPVGGLVRVASAGHPPALVLAPDGTVTWLTGGRGAPLASGGPPPTDAVAALPPGTTLLLYTDGAVERRGRTLEQGFAALAEIVRDAAGDDGAGPLCDRVVDRLLADAGPHDDVAMLAVRIASRPLRPLVRDVPALPGELAPLRRDAREWLGRAGIGEDRARDVLLALGEAAANAVEHAYAGEERGQLHVELRQREPGEVVVEVRDGGRWREPSGPREGRGHGLALMSRVMDEVDVDREPEGTAVSMRCRAPLPGEHEPFGTGTALAAPPPAPPAGARVRVSRGRDALTVALTGDFDLATAGPALAQALAAAGTEPVLLDLAGVGYLDSAAIRALVRTRDTLVARGCTVTMLAPAGSPARHHLTLVGLDDALEAVPA